MNSKLILLVSFIIALVVGYFTWDSVNVKDVTAEKLSGDYAEDIVSANEIYLGKMLRVEGIVKAYYKILGARPVLELETGENKIPVFFFFLSQENETYAGQLELGQKVVIKGKCVGEEEYKFVNGIKIEVEEFVH